MLPWAAPGLPGGQVQLDFVFNEPLRRRPSRWRWRGSRCWALGRELSLAWKLMWLVGDMYPQGKDLYDAVLLAEDRVLPYPLLEEVFRQSGEWESGGVHEPPVLEVFDGFRGTDWSTFEQEYPGIDVSGDRHARRLLELLAPTFEEGAR